MAAPEEADLKGYLLNFARYGEEHPELSAGEAAERFSEMIKAGKCGGAGKRNAEESVGEDQDQGRDEEGEEGEGERRAPVRSQPMIHSASASSYNASMSAFAFRSGRAPQQYPVSLSRTEKPPQQQQQQQHQQHRASFSDLQSLDLGNVPTLTEYLGQHDNSEPFPLIEQAIFPTSIKSYPQPVEFSSTLDMYAPRMQHQLSSSTSGYFTGDEGSSFDSPHSYSHPMSSHSRSYSQESFASSYMGPTSPIDRYTAMSREASSASLPHAGMEMLKVDEGYSGEIGVAHNNVSIFLNDPPKQSKRASSVSIEDLDSEAVQAPRAQKRMKENGQEGDDASGKDSSSSSRSRRSRGGERRRNGASADGDSGPQYVRPAHPRVYCLECNEVPDGFRGDHELRRHVEREHLPTKKMWFIKDISDDKKFLSKCKACMSGKRYGQDYNAAAHLRRQHFSPQSGERRKRHQGGDQEQSPTKKCTPPEVAKVPDMAELRKWMEEVEVKVESTAERSSEPWQPPEGEGTQQVSAAASKKAVEDPDPTDNQDDIAPQPFKGLPSGLPLDAGQEYPWDGTAGCNAYEHFHACNLTVEYTATSGAHSLSDAYAQNANMRYLQPDHPSEGIFPGPAAGKDTAGMFLDDDGGMNFY